MGIGWTQILVLFLIVLLLFGGKKLPELAHSLGKSLNEFKKGKNEDVDSDTTSQVKTKTVTPQVAQQTVSVASTAGETITPEVVK